MKLGFSLVLLSSVVLVNTAQAEWFRRQQYQRPKSHGTVQAAQPIRPNSSEQAVKLPPVSVKDYIEGRFVGERFQYKDKNGNWQFANYSYRGTNVDKEEKLEFLNAAGDAVSYKEGDVLFEVKGMGWFKAEKDSPVMADPDEAYVINPEGVDLTPIERMNIILTNKARVANGRSILTVSARLMNLARQKSLNQARSSTMSHGVYPPNPGRENVAYGQGSAESVVNTWLNSSGHYANIMATDTKYIGVGSESVGGPLYHTQMFTR